MSSCITVMLPGHEQRETSSSSDLGALQRMDLDLQGEVIFGRLLHLAKGAMSTDPMEKWVDVSDLDGFNLGYVTSPASFRKIS
ncbi:NtaA/SnaA/SoxA family monooxygenase [Colletotrichum lupini]|uniref:NtaA/SnaA/SoxA family monooxygenase n=1 Tax=Colletotrichum lupini TaxID=145971 RepID=A0A9Q8SUC8_9PEZI|nr:NtaA/SnaA/SoxA family monooxygenase [Colletotrichum lupini]UQC82727.1 NtaA/SnaA/SoxA family monooxygenase [Colletotrichum lupini]